MPRKPRNYLSGIPAHVVQRGNNRNACFFTEDDYLFYLECLRAGLRRYAVKLHAYVLMTNHVHLLLTPSDETGISRLLQHIGRLYVLYVNKTYRRSGTLWEGRHKSSLVDAEHYLLACYRYIEMNPVAAGMIETPDQYRWSSYAWHAWGKPDRLITDHELYKRLGLDPKARQLAYRGLFQYHLAEKDVHAIRESLAYNYPLGNNRFREQIEATLGRGIGQKQRGRPKRQTENAQI
jgi:REP-associated tyrosine transposase